MTIVLTILAVAAVGALAIVLHGPDHPIDHHRYRIAEMLRSRR